MKNYSYPILIGKMKMSSEEFYDGYLNEDNRGKYTIPKTLTRLIDKYPPTTSKLETVKTDSEITYNFLDVDVAVCASDLQDNANLAAIWDKVTNIITVNSADDLADTNLYKVKLLQADGTFSNRVLLDDSLNKNVKDISSEFSIEKDFYSLMSYSYACVFGSKTAAEDYTEFQDFYGKYVYGITLEHSKGKIGLVWLDYIMHPPKGHLELGVHASAAGSRFQEFNCWDKGDTLTITVMADGFTDLVITKSLEEMTPVEETNKLYAQALEKVASPKI